MSPFCVSASPLNSHQASKNTLSPFLPPSPSPPHGDYVPEDPKFHPLPQHPPRKILFTVKTRFISPLSFQLGVFWGRAESFLEQTPVKIRGERAPLPPNIVPKLDREHLDLGGGGTRCVLFTEATFLHLSHHRERKKHGQGKNRTMSQPLNSCFPSQNAPLLSREKKK